MMLPHPLDKQIDHLGDRVTEVDCWTWKVDVELDTVDTAQPKIERIIRELEAALRIARSIRVGLETLDLAQRDERLARARS
jgi:hypothetical protein